MGILLDCGIDDTGLQILSCIVGVAIYISIGPNLTFSVGMASFLSFSILFGCSVWNRSVVYRFISDTRTRTGLCLAIRIDSSISSLYCQDIPDSVTVNCKGCN